MICRKIKSVYIWTLCSQRKSFQNLTFNLTKEHLLRIYWIFLYEELKSAFSIIAPKIKSKVLPILSRIFVYLYLNLHGHSRPRAFLMCFNNCFTESFPWSLNYHWKLDDQLQQKKLGRNLKFCILNCSFNEQGDNNKDLLKVFG